MGSCSSARGRSRHAVPDLDCRRRWVSSPALTYLVQCTSFGSRCSRWEAGRRAALFSGVAVTRTRMIAFVISPACSPSSPASSTSATTTPLKPTIATDQLLPAITAVILGGVSAYGGTGTIPGVALAVIVLLLDAPGRTRAHRCFRSGADDRRGGLLIVAIGAGAVIRRLQDSAGRPRRTGPTGQEPAAESALAGRSQTRRMCNRPRRHEKAKPRHTRTAAMG